MERAPRHVRYKGAPRVLGTPVPGKRKRIIKSRRRVEQTREVRTSEQRQPALEPHFEIE
jgi:hypothetical protein